MALIIPAVMAEDTESAGEQTLFPVLRDRLDDSYTVFHSFRTLTHDAHGMLRDGELDFLIFSPQRGLLALEVKSGEVIYDGATRRWSLNQMPIRDPVEQARNGKYRIRDFLHGRLGRPLQCAFAHAVCFPHTIGAPEKLPPDVDRIILLTGPDLDSLSERIAQIFAASGTGHRPLSDAEADKVRHALMPHCEYGVRLTDRIGREEQQFFSLTEEQCRMLDFIRNQRTALIEGCAGSGKSVMAVKKARELAAAGHSVLLLAYNQLIGQQLAAAVADVPGVTAGTYHDYCIARLDEEGCLPPGERNTDFYERAVPEAFYNLVSRSRLQYDAIIVDEGQDFRTDFWISISCLLRDSGYFYIFYDPDQNVFGTDMDFPIAGPPFVLAENCRNTREICAYVARHTEQTMRPMDRSPEGFAVEEFVSPSLKGRRRKVGAILHHLVYEEGLSPERIVILGGHRIDNTSIPPGTQAGVFTVVEGGKPGTNTIRYYTYMKFKGCEADAVILLDVDPSDSRWSNRAVYTTASRAKHVLYVVRTA